MIASKIRRLSKYKISKNNGRTHGTGEPEYEPQEIFNRRSDTEMQRLFILQGPFGDISEARMLIAARICAAK